MIQRITQKLLLAGVTASTLANMALAQTGIDEGAQKAQPTNTPTDLQASFAQISNTIIFLVGAVAVIVLIIGGFRYIISQGDAAQVKAAKDTILYAVIGVIVAILAYAIVHFISISFPPPKP